VPWYVTISLFLLSPLYATQIRDKLLPRVQDWWAARSKRTIQRQIAKLEKQLNRPQTFDDIVLRLFNYGLSAVALISFGLLAIVGAMGEAGVVRTIAQWLSIVFFTIAGFVAQRGHLLALIAQGQDASEYEQEFADRIEKLKKKINAREKPSFS
jgi:hypothetical protein